MVGFSTICYENIPHDFPRCCLGRAEVWAQGSDCSGPGDAMNFLPLPSPNTTLPSHHPHFRVRTEDPEAHGEGGTCPRLQTGSWSSHSPAPALFPPSSVLRPLGIRGQTPRGLSSHLSGPVCGPGRSQGLQARLMRRGKTGKAAYTKIINFKRLSICR